MKHNIISNPSPQSKWANRKHKMFLTRQMPQKRGVWKMTQQKTGGERFRERILAKRKVKVRAGAGVER